MSDKDLEQLKMKTCNYYTSFMTDFFAWKYKIQIRTPKFSLIQIKNYNFFLNIKKEFWSFPKKWVDGKNVANCHNKQTIEFKKNLL